MTLVGFGRGGPIVTLGIALLFLWWAISGTRPRLRPPQEDGAGITMRPFERLLWGFFGVVLILYELVKFMRWTSPVNP